MGHPWEVGRQTPMPTGDQERPWDPELLSDGPDNPGYVQDRHDIGYSQTGIGDDAYVEVPGTQDEYPRDINQANMTGAF